MKPAVKSKKWAVLLSLVVAGFGFWWYLRPFWWMGVIMGLGAGLFTFLILNSRRMERYRRIYFILLFVIAILSMTVVVADMGPDTFLAWAGVHEKEYYLPGQTIGTLTYACTRDVPQLLLGRASFIKGIGWQTSFPDTMNTFWLFMVPYIATGIFFSRAFCGWICPFGGLTEAFVTGKRERWAMPAFKNKLVSKRGIRFEGLKEWVKDTKYGILLALVLLSFALSFPIVCIFCPVLWLEVTAVLVMVLLLVLIFAVVLPFMTKRRWFCFFICPIGALFALLNKISFFRVKMDKKKCIKCNDCVQECRTYALTPKMVENFKSPNEDCIRCGRCIEACPEDAMDIYWAGTNIKARPVFITAAVITALAWYAWFLLLIVGLPK